jgi:sugar lactone lactonase YvrE
MVLSAAPPTSIWPLAAELGEGPIWVAREAALYFVDIKGRRIHRLRPETGEHRSWDAPSPPGFIAPLDDGGFVCGLQGGLHRFDPRTGGFDLARPVEADQPENRINDGAVDVHGRLWFGTMHDPESAPTGGLYSLGADGALTLHDHGYVVTNGPATSPDGRTLYHTDTFERVVHAFDLDAEGRPSNRRVLMRIEGPGWPDGTTVDSEGCLWVALWGGWGVERWSAQGERLGRVALPCANVTKLAFGGADLRTAYVTTARKGLSPAELDEQPQAGDLFSFRCEVAGLTGAALAATALDL